MTKAQLENAIRTQFLDLVREMVSDKVDTDALPVSASELAVPCVDEEGNEKFVIIKVSVPRGTRNGEGGYNAYDGYAAAEDYRLECEEKAQKKAEAEAKKQAKKKKDEEEGE